MDTPANEFESLFERIEAYIKTSYDLAKLKALESAIVVVTSLISRLSVIVMFSLFALVLNIGIALYLGELLGKSYYGFFIVAAFYFIGGIIFQLFMHKWIKKPLSELIITQALK